MTNEGDIRRFRIRLERPEGTFTFDAISDEYLLYSMIDAGIETPYICEQGWCLACAARLVSGNVDRSDALTVYPQDAEAGFLLLCSTKPCSDLVLMLDERQTRRDMMQHRIEHNQLARAYPPGARLRFRRGRAKARVCACTRSATGTRTDEPATSAQMGLIGSKPK
ncbi:MULTISPECIES: 2Fe-2S iron-sulfur cluster binding domain-containing protein [unclassified Bradyrhizobium]|uniref:2Fe-2S iron-sulfur cluster binding domain-containing protein n=1 Tax=unclassified Bradyrhizobium TaxID=2631580 RepID=UPI00291618DE|nr:MULTISPECIES: 2Fe-2S iron-sulfur cluster binding domain-containing protein [unclassified Bradyrhizobium]